MLVFSGTNNTTDCQIENGTSYLVIEVEKTKGFDTLPEFFGDQDLTKCDKIKVLYTSRDRGQKSIIPSLPVLPLAVVATSNEGFGKCYLDAQGKIVKVEFQIEIGVGGALDLNNNAYLSLTTSFTDVKALKIYVTDGIKTPFIHMYETVHLNPNVQKEVALVGATHILLSKDITDFNLLRPEGYAIESEEKELEVISQALNENAFAYGTEQVYNRIIGGQSIPSKPSFLIQKWVAGGAFYNNVGVSDAARVYVTSAYDDRVYLLKTQDTTTM